MDDNDKAMVPCSTVSLRTLADGTIRFTVDVEPLNSAVAFKAFATPGTPCVLAVLGNDVAKKEMVADEAKKAGRCPQAIEYHGKHGKWPSNTAEGLCKEKNFYRYLVKTNQAEAPLNYDSAKRILKGICDDIESRTELDTNHGALTTFKGMLADYREFVQDQK